MFDFVDLFAGVGGFHAAMSRFGGAAVLAAEIDAIPAKVYEQNWRLRPHRDVRDLSADTSLVPDHAVLTGGFPCQPFSKSGHQRGLNEDRGTLFYDIVAILEARRPAVVMLENVRNLAGPRQKIAWLRLIHGLRKAGYLVSSEPCVFSPHLLSPEDGGAAQVRERVYILGVYVGAERALKETNIRPPVLNRAQNGWDPQMWSFEEHVLLPEAPDTQARYGLRDDEIQWIETWNDLLARLNGVRLPGFPLWEQYWSDAPVHMEGLPQWKQKLIQSNLRFYEANRSVIEAWRQRGKGTDLETFPPSRRKLEWQAQGAPHDLWGLAIQLRPSGIRVKRPTYTPALVAMNQTTIYGPRRRRLTPLETARLQGFDVETFTFGLQTDSSSYKQMGNAVNAGAAAYVFRRFVEQHEEDVRKAPGGADVVNAVIGMNHVSRKADAA